MIVVSGYGYIFLNIGLNLTFVSRIEPHQLDKDIIMFIPTLCYESTEMECKTKGVLWCCLEEIAEDTGAPINEENTYRHKLSPLHEIFIIIMKCPDIPCTLTQSRSHGETERTI